MRKPLRTLFYGVTHEHAAGKLATLRRLADDFEIVAVVDDRSRSSPYFVNEVVGMEGLDLISEDELKSFSGFDVAFVETVNGRLMEVATRLVDNGIPLHCDKPCGEAMEPYRSLVEKCRVRDLPFQVGYMYRGNPAIRFVQDAVRKGALGKISFVEADMNHDYGKRGYAEFVSSFRGGILYNLGCHLIDAVLPMIDGDFIDASPLLCPAPHDPPGSKTKGLSVLRFKDTEILIRCSSNMPGGVPCRRLRIDGSNGTIDLCPIERFDGEELKLVMTLRERVGDFPAGCHEYGFGVQSDRYAPQLLELASIVRGERANDQDYDRDLRTHELTLNLKSVVELDK